MGVFETLNVCSNNNSNNIIINNNNTAILKLFKLLVFSSMYMTKKY